MKYLAVQKAAALDLVGDRRYQSVDFVEGRSLAALTRGPSQDFHHIRVGAVEAPHGIIVVGENPQKDDYIVFDIAGSGIFSDGQDDMARLQCLQKTLRFAVKYWSGTTIFNASERIIHDSGVAVIFPFPISQLTGYRIVVELRPDEKRLSARDTTSRYLLVGYAGTEEKPSQAGHASFRKFLEEKAVIPANFAASSVTGEELSALTVTELEHRAGEPASMFQAYDAWMRAVTDRQRSFIERRLSAPSRLEGPAGTGKTLSLCLKAMHDMLAAEKEGRECSALLLTHSEATRKSIEEVLLSMGAEKFISAEGIFQRLSVNTLQNLCAELLGQDIQDTEFLDRDALEAKNTQLLMVDEVLRSIKPELASYRPFLSPEMDALVTLADTWTLAEMFQHEIAVVIKGRASQDYDVYLKTTALSSGLPIRNAGDKAFCWRVFSLYNETLKDSGQFDTDDVVISTYMQLSTPIWKRRRVIEGYDELLVDETHLFNMNELSVLHALTKDDVHYPIAFVVDRSQAIGDRGWSEGDEAIENPSNSGAGDVTEVKAVFRSSPAIVQLAFTITSSGAQLFTNFHNPLDMAYSVQTLEDERKSAKPTYLSFTTDDEMLSAAFDRAEVLAKDLECRKGDIAIICFGDDLFDFLRKRVEVEHKPVSILKARGDNDLVRRAQQDGKFVLSLPDYVGGLEFLGVILVGVDKGRVPVTPIAGTDQSRAYLDYVAHNRLYVAITRARYRVEILGTKERGLSPFIERARDAGALEIL